MSNEKSGFEESGIFNYIDPEKSASRVSRVPKALMVAAATVVVLAGVQAASGLVGPMLLALFLAIVLLVPLRWLQNHGCPLLLAFLFVMLFTITLFVGIMYFIAGSMNEFIDEIPKIRDKVVERYNKLEQQLGQIGFRLGNGENEQAEPIVPAAPETPLQTIPPVAVSPNEAIDSHDAKFLEGEADETEQTSIGDDNISSPSLAELDIDKLLEKLEKEQPSLTDLDPQSVALWLARIAVHARHMLEGSFLVLIFTIFMLLEASYFPTKVKRAFSKDSPINIEHFQRIADDVRRYLILKTVSNLMSGAAAMGVYCWFEVPGWFFFGIIAFFMYYIPNIGGTLAAIIPGLLIFINADISMVLLYTLCLLTVECAIAYGIEPKLLGHGLRLSTLVIILSLFFWGFLLGAIGLFLAAPLTVMIKIVLQAFPETRWIAIFLDGGHGETH